MTSFINVYLLVSTSLVVRSFCHVENKEKKLFFRSLWFVSPPPRGGDGAKGEGGGGRGCEVHWIWLCRWPAIPLSELRIRMSRPIRSIIKNGFSVIIYRWKAQSWKKISCYCPFNAGLVGVRIPSCFMILDCNSLKTLKYKIVAFAYVKRFNDLCAT